MPEVPKSTNNNAVIRKATSVIKLRHPKTWGHLRSPKQRLWSTASGDKDSEYHRDSSTGRTIMIC